MIDIDVFEKLYLKYRSLMLCVAVNILHDRYLAEDAVQMSFENISKYVKYIDDVDSSKTRNLVVVICKNAALYIYKSRKKYKISDDDDDNLLDLADDFNLEDFVIDNNSVDIIKKSFRKLKSIYSDVLSLHEINSLSYEEIGKLLNLNSSTVKKRVQRARKMLMESLVNTSFQE